MSRKGSFSGGGGAPSLSSDLIRRANEAGTVADLGDATAREYDRNVSEISEMDLSDAERASAYSRLHELTEAQLEAEAGARSAYAPGMGPARFNGRQMSRNADRAANARSETKSFMDEMRGQQRQRARQRENEAVVNASRQAIANGALSFTVNGKTYTRKSTRSKTFTA